MEMFQDIMSGGRPLSFAPVNFPAVIEEVVTIVGQRYPDVKIYSDSPTNFTANTDEWQIGRVMTNLLVNAVEHSREGLVRVVQLPLFGQACTLMYQSGVVDYDIVERLRTTKSGFSTKGKKGNGLGFISSRQELKRLKGYLEIYSHQEILEDLQRVALLPKYENTGAITEVSINF